MSAAAASGVFGGLRHHGDWARPANRSAPSRGGSLASHKPHTGPAPGGRPSPIFVRPSCRSHNALSAAAHPPPLPITSQTGGGAQSVREPPLPAQVRGGGVGWRRRPLAGGRHSCQQRGTFLPYPPLPSSALPHAARHIRARRTPPAPLRVLCAGVQRVCGGRAGETAARGGARAWWGVVWRFSLRAIREAAYATLEPRRPSFLWTHCRR